MGNPTVKAEPLTRVEISQKALIHNLGQFRRRVEKRIKIMAVVKANAYGHGILEVSKIVSQNGADWLGVNSLGEGLVIRQEGIKLPILVLGYIPLSEIEGAIRNDLSFVVYNRQTIKEAEVKARPLKKKAKVHLKLETGTYRQGIEVREIAPFTEFCLKQENIFLEGIYTHYANIEDTLDSSFAMEQLKTFKRALSAIGGSAFGGQLIKSIIKHTACSAATILFKETYFDLVRVGIGLYGLWPSRETKISAKEEGIKLDLCPVLTWKTGIVQLKEVEKGKTIGYGRTFTTNRKTKIAVLPVGYWDGYDRKLSNSGRVLIHGQFAPVVGRVCMNMVMVDVTDIPKIKIEDEVVLLGKQGKNEVTAEEIAQKIGTINYEVITRINPLLPRTVV